MESAPRLVFRLALTAAALTLAPAAIAPSSMGAQQSTRPLISRDPAQVSITIEQRVPSCFGCLEFRADFQGPRTMRFQCLSGCALPGRQEARMDEFDFVALVRAVDTANFFQLPRTVGGCIDCPILTVTYRDQTRIHEVVDTGGTAPDALRALQRKLMSLTAPFDIYKEPTAANYRALIAAGWTPNERLASDETMLNHAVRGGDADAVKYLLERGAKINRRALDDAAQSTPKVLDAIWTATKATQASPAAVRWLVRAASSGHQDNVSWLIGRGVPVDAFDAETGLTALLGAAASGSTGVVDRLLARGANPLLKDASGGNALWHAAETDSTPSIVSLMLKRGLPVDGPSLDGRTPLMHAAESCAAGNVRLLLEASADARLKDRQGRTAFDFTPAGHGHKASQCQVVKGLLGK